MRIDHRAQVSCGPIIDFDVNSAIGTGRRVPGACAGPSNMPVCGSGASAKCCASDKCIMPGGCRRNDKQATCCAGAHPHPPSDPASGPGTYRPTLGPKYCTWEPVVNYDTVCFASHRQLWQYSRLNDADSVLGPHVSAQLTRVASVPGNAPRLCAD